MRIHLVAIDLDGTLLNSDKEITDATAAILRTARETAGVHIVLATARPPRSVLPFYDLLDLDAPMINYNGALVYDPTCQRVVLHRPLALETARECIDLARSICPDVLVSVEVLDRWYTDRVDLRYTTETGKRCAPDVVGPIDEWLTQPVTKLLLLDGANRLATVRDSIRRRFRHQVTILQTEGTLLQITHATVSKAEALRVVAGEMGVDREQVMAIGDNANDVSMLKWAGVGVAMANAAPQALAAADYVTDDHNADGAAKAIRDIILRGLPGKRP